MRRIAAPMSSFMLALVALAASPATAAGWQWANPRPQGDAVSALAGNGTTTVAITGATGGGRGLISTRDGVRWHARSLPEGVFASGLAWGDGRFIGVGKAGAVVSSGNGMGWSAAATIDPGFDLRAAAWGNGRYVAVGAHFVGSNPEGVITSSADGVDWTVHPHPIQGNSSFHDVAFTNGRFVVAGEPGVLLTSTDGMAWNAAPVPYVGTIEAIAGCGGRFVAIGTEWPWALDMYGDTLVSVDGDSWRLHRRALPTTILGDISCHDNLFIAVGGMGGADTYVARSQDGVSWTSSAPDSINAPLTVAWDGARFVVGGEFGFLSTSDDGNEWKTRSNAQGQHDLQSVTHADGRYVAVGLAGTALRSFDGRTWTHHPQEDVHFHDVTHGGVPGATRFVAVGRRFADPAGSDQGTAAYSDDGATWNVAQSPVGAALRAVAWGNDRFVAVGDAGSALVSADGTAWTSPSEPDPARTFKRLVFGAGVFLALYSDPAGDRAYVSVDAETWMPVELPATSIADATWTGSQFLAVSREGRSLASEDGVHWQLLEGPVSGPYVRVAWNGHEYRGLRESFLSTIGISTDGVHWRDEAMNAHGTPRALASAGRQWVAVGKRGSVLVAGDAIFAADFD